jgi:calcineurin-like phosphoesterase family protein
MTTWFTSDHHFGHENIIKLCKRPFTSLHEMNEVMTQRWNERVQPADIVYHLGDFAFKDHARYLDRLNGTKHLILGNHDHKGVRSAGNRWASVNDMLTLKGLVPIVLCHYSLRVWNKAHYGALHFYGHSHGSLPGDSQCLDVGVDCWDFRPVTLEEILTRLSKQPKRYDVDHHKQAKNL